MENQINNQPERRGIGKLLVSFVVVLILGLVWWLVSGREAAPAPGLGDVNGPASDGGLTPVTNRKYKNGTYAAVGNYVSPAGAEAMNISITLVDDKITAATFVGQATHPTSMKMQGMFKTGFSSLVVGKNIDEVSLTAVNGSSLAPKGFMDALEKVKVAATAS